MKTYLMYFSPTGGTEKVMGILGQPFEPEGRIDLTVNDTDYSKYIFGKEDLCLVGAPSFGGRVPDAALKAMGAMKGNGAGAVMAAVFGNRAYDDTLLELKDTMESCGFEVIAAIAAVAEHSIMHQFGKGRPDAQDERELTDFAVKIFGRIKEGLTGNDLQVPGVRPYREYNGVPFKPKGDKSCVKCGLCAVKCPVQAIPEDAPDSVDAKKCISCMRCVALCPQYARKLNKLMLSAASQSMKKACESRKENELFI